MATDKVSLGGVWVSRDCMEKLKELHGISARRHERTGNKQTFSSWMEMKLMEMVMIEKAIKDKEWNEDDFE